MPLTVGTNAGEYPPTIGYVINGEPADDITFNRPIEDLNDRTDAIKTCLDAFPISEVVGLSAALAGASPLHTNLGQITSLDYASNPLKIFAVDAVGVATLIDNTLQGENNTGSNLGTGEGSVFSGKVGVDLQFRTLKAGTNISITQTANEIEITAAPGEIFQLTKLVKNETGSVVVAGTPVSWLDNGTMQLADANILTLSDFCGIVKVDIPNGDYGLVVKLGDVPGILASLNPVVGAHVYMGEAPGTYSLTPPPLVGDTSLISLGRAEPPSGVAGAAATSLYLQPVYISEGGL